MIGQGGVEQSDLLPAGPGFVSCSRLPNTPQGARGGRARGRGWAWGTPRGPVRPPRGLFGERGLGRGGGGGSRLNFRAGSAGFNALTPWRAKTSPEPVAATRTPHPLLPPAPPSPTYRSSSNPLSISQRICICTSTGIVHAVTPGVCNHLQQCSPDSLAAHLVHPLVDVGSL
jgi:hypothetical protein